MTSQLFGTLNDEGQLEGTAGFKFVVPMALGYSFITLPARFKNSNEQKSVLYSLYVKRKRNHIMISYNEWPQTRNSLYCKSKVICMWIFWHMQQLWWSSARLSIYLLTNAYTCTPFMKKTESNKCIVCLPKLQEDSKSLQAFAWSLEVGLRIQDGRSGNNATVAFRLNLHQNYTMEILSKHAWCGYSFSSMLIPTGACLEYFNSNPFEARFSLPGTAALLDAVRRRAGDINLFFFNTNLIGQ